MMFCNNNYTSNKLGPGLDIFHVLHYKPSKKEILEYVIHVL